MKSLISQMKEENESLAQALNLAQRKIEKLEDQGKK